MKGVKQIFAIALAACTLFAVGCKDGCKKENTDNTEEYTVNSVGEYEGGIHELNYTKTDDYFVKENKTEYSILIPATASSEIIYAAEELKELVYEATKCDLAIVTDDTVEEYSNAKRYVSLGNTTYAAAVEAKPTEELDNYGYSIQTVDKCIFINANTDIGVTFGVYGFLELQFNFDCFTDECYTIDKQNNAPLLDFDVRDVPDLGANEQANSLYQVGDGLRRMRVLEREEIRAIPDGLSTSTHSTLRIVTLEKYFEAHPKWFATNLRQLCYTAQGDEKEFELFVQTVADIFIDMYRKTDLTHRIIAFGQMDEAVWCACKACSAAKTKYNSDAAVQIQFINKVAAKVEAWMETEEGKPHARDFEILYFAYHKSIEPPVIYDDSTGKYVPVDETVMPADHTMVFLAPIEMDPHCDINADCNATWMTRLEKWKGLMEHSEGQVAVWTYYRNYNFGWLPFDSYTSMQNWYRYIATLNVGMHYEETGISLTGDFGNWYSLRSYLHSKLAWNVNYDIETLTEKFFQNYFGDAADEMYDVFLATRAVSNNNREAICDNRSIFNSLDVAEYWPETLAVEALAKMEKGLADIAYLKKTEPARYASIYKHIAAERFTYEYILIEYYGQQYDPEYIIALKQQAKADVELNEISTIGSGMDVSAVWKKWGM